jgi:iron(III) transport system substrate-binding protein
MTRHLRPVAVGLLTIGLWLGASVAQAQDVASLQNWQGNADWNATIAAAKKEGKLVIAGPPGATWREPLTAFAQDYGIPVELTQIDITFWTRLRQERTVGQYLWDLVVLPPSTDAYRMINEDHAIEDVRSMLVLPEVVDDKAWAGGFENLFNDNGRKYSIGFSLQATPAAWVNRDKIPASDLKTMDQLIEPRFKGMMSSQDYHEGAPLNLFGPLIRDPRYGADFVKKMLANDITFVANGGQQVDWLIRGKYPIALGILTAGLLNAKAQGIADHVEPLPGILRYSSGNSGILVFKEAPHPNATKAYVNWLLTKRAQQLIADKVKYNSRRLDVAPVDPSTTVDVSRLKDYINTHREDISPYYAQWVKLAEESVKH